MTDQEQQLVLEMIEKTGQGRIKWERQDDADKLVAVLENGLRVRTWLYLEEGYQGALKLVGYELEIRSEEGATGIDLWEEGQQGLLAQLYDAAEGSVLSYERALIVIFIERTQHGELRWERDDDRLGCLRAVDPGGALLCHAPWFREPGGGEGVVGGHVLEIHDREKTCRLGDDAGPVGHLHDAARASIEARAIRSASQGLGEPR